MPSGKLLRWVAAVDQVPGSMTEYDVIPVLPVNCDDSNLCTVDDVDPAGLCVHSPISCDDGNECTMDACSTITGQCDNTSLACNDNDACTADSCVSGSGCQHAPIVLTEPAAAEFTSTAVIQWEVTPDASHWNTYRGTIPAGMLGSRLAGTVYDQVCRESGDALGDGPTISTDTALPSPGTAFYYLISAESGCEGDIGHASSGMPIPNTAPCPTPP